jgi:hypothetical protein
MQAVAALHNHEHDGLRLFRPTKLQEKALRRMSLEQCFEILIVAGNRAGKSVLAAAFFASFVRDEPITTWNGEKIHCRPKRLRGMTVNTWVIGDHLKHIGMTVYRLLFEKDPSKGLFKIIRDESTGSWRAWQPVMFPNDWARKNETVWAPPIIPENVIADDGWSWAQGRKADNEFRKVKMKNGSTIYAFASSAEVKQGDPCDLIWNDENIVNKWYYQEWLGRLRDEEGMMMWSTIPRDNCYIFNEVISRLEDQEEEVDSGQRDPAEHFTAKIELSYLDSPFIPDRQKELALEQAGDRDAMVRIYGKRSTQLISIYQDFNANYHCVNFGNEQLNDAVTNVLRENNWLPPADWTRELIVDPGTQKPAVLLGAIPPPSFWDDGEPYYVCYREIFIRRASPSKIAEEVMRTERDFTFERFIIDNRCGRQKPPGFVETVAFQYTKAFRHAGLVSRQTGSDFISGDDNFARRSKQVITSMRSRPCGRPQLRIITQACPNLVKQLNSNVRKTTPDGEPTEVAADNQVDDMRETLEYWISRRPTYFEPPVVARDVRSPAQIAHDHIVNEFMENKARQPTTQTLNIGIPA